MRDNNLETDEPVLVTVLIKRRILTLRAFGCCVHKMYQETNNKPKKKMYKLEKQWGEQKNICG